jgi:hypothetical protein
MEATPTPNKPDPFVNGLLKANSQRNILFSIGDLLKQLQTTARAVPNILLSSQMSPSSAVFPRSCPLPLVTKAPMMIPKMPIAMLLSTKFVLGGLNRLVQCSDALIHSNSACIEERI